MFPQHVLNKLYLPGSLKNTDAGFEFSIKNVVDSTSLFGFGPIMVDGQEVPLAQVGLQVGQQVLRADEINNQKRIAVYYNTLLTIRITGQALAAGTHKVSISVSSVDVGKVKLEFEETI